MKAETNTHMREFVLTTIGTLAIILSQAGSSWAAEAGAGTVEFRSARFTGSGSLAPIPAPQDAHPMFSTWLIGGDRQTITCEFSAKPNTAYQIFVGFNEAWWDKPGQRVMDIEVAGKSKVAWDGKSTAVAGAVETAGRIVATADAFQKAKGVPSAVVFPVETDAQAKLVIRVRAHPGAPDQNPVVCISPLL